MADPTLEVQVHRPLPRGIRLPLLSFVAMAVVVTALSNAADPPVAASQRRVITNGHLDVFKAVWTGSALVMRIGDDSVPGSPQLTNPDDVVLNPGPAHAITFPPTAPASLAGSSGFLMTQTSPNLTERLWPGWSTERPSTPSDPSSIGGLPGLPAGVINGNLSLRILSVDGPGTLVIWTVSGLGASTVLVDTANGLPDTITVPQGSHVHANWGFSAPGTYTIVAEMTGAAVGGGTLSTGPTTYRWQVGSTEAVTVLATPELTPLMTALADAIPELVLVPSTSTTMSVPGCVPTPEARPRPASGSDYVALLGGSPYTGIGGTAVVAQGVACRPDAVSVAGRDF